MTRKIVIQAGLICALLVALGSGCGKSEPRGSALVSPDAAPLILRLHWLGKEKIAGDPEGTNFMAIWNLPESQRLQAQTLDKLATAPWRFLTSGQPLSNAPVALLRPLLDDLVQSELLFEVRAQSSAATTAQLGLQLPPDRIALWLTNLPNILKSFGNSSVAESGGGLSFAWSNVVFAAARSEDGKSLLLQFAIGTNVTISSPRLSPPGFPRGQATTNWMAVTVDAGRFLDRFAPDLLRGRSSGVTNLPVLSISLRGEGGNVRTLGSLSFPAPVALVPEDWNVPTNLVHDPLCSFTAVRGFRPWLRLLGWDESTWGEPPNQFFGWAQTGTPPLHFFAFPSPQSSNLVEKMGDYLLKSVNPVMASGASVQGTPVGAFERNDNSGRIRWRGLPLISPELDWIPNAGNPFVTGGLFGNRLTNRPAPVELLNQLAGDASLLAYDWEFSRVGTYRLIQSSQLARYVFGRGRLSMTNNLSLPWLVAVSPLLGPSGTSLRLASDRELTFSRSSSIGLTAWELHLLVEWLESPRFPEGFYSLLTPKPAAETEKPH